MLRREKNNINKIIFLILFKHFEIQDYYRFDIDKISQWGFKPEIWVLCDLYYDIPIEKPRMCYNGREICYISTNQVLKEKLESVKINESFFIFYPGEANDCITNDLIKTIKKNNGYYANYHYPLSLEKTYLNKNRKRNILEVIKFYNNKWKNDPYVAYQDVKRIYRDFRYPSSFEILQGEASYSRVFNEFLKLSNKCRVLHSFDYDTYLRNKTVRRTKNITNGINKKYAVFIDEYLVAHTDLKKQNRQSPIKDIAQYYQNLNHLFSLIEKRYGVEVVIAEHPKAEYEVNPYDGRKMFKYRTHELIEKASLCILIASVCHSYILMNRKPYFQIYTDDLAEDYELFKEIIRYQECGLSNIANVNQINEENIDSFLNRYSDKVHKKYVDYYMNPIGTELNMHKICRMINKVKERKIL